MTRRLAVDIIVFLYIILFVYAAVSKLMDFQKFSVQLGQSPILTAYAGLLAWTVPASELIISMLLVLPRARLYGLYAGFSLMLMFTTYIVLASRFSDYVPCTCGGIIENLSWTGHLIFNVAFNLMALAGILLHIERKHETTFYQPEERY